jgi:hypothetical protein
MIRELGLVLALVLVKGNADGESQVDRGQCQPLVLARNGVLLGPTDILAQF